MRNVFLYNERSIAKNLQKGKRGSSKTTRQKTCTIGQRPFSAEGKYFYPNFYPFYWVRYESLGNYTVVLNVT